ncbi:MAG: hypothetical protein IJ480_12540 [Clostridia bacterium]|nr:hypothetical protein [Clostridia bacterium]
MKTRRWIAFICTAALLQGLMLLFSTETGLLALYPYLVRASEEEYQTKGAYTVYYDMRLPLTDAPFVAVGMDFEVAQSYDAFQHLFRFIKQYRNITDILLCDRTEYAEGIRARMSDPLTDPGLPAILLDFADTLAAINDTQLPNKKCTVGVWEESDYQTLHDGTVLLLMDRDAMMENYAVLQETGAVCVEMKYINCPAGDELRTDIRLPFTGEAPRFSFLPASRIDWFYRYYRRVTNLFGLTSMEDTAAKLDGISADFLICIANGQAAALETVR